MKTNDGKHIAGIIDRVGCKKHSAEKGVACWAIDPGKGRDTYLLAICNKRAVLAGVNGTISESSYQLNKRTLSKPKSRS